VAGFTALNWFKGRRGVTESGAERPIAPVKQISKRRKGNGRNPKQLKDPLAEYITPISYLVDEDK
jgi:hypothetical protein